MGVDRTRRAHAASRAAKKSEGYGAKKNRKMESEKFTMMKTTRTRTRNWMLKKTTSAMGPQAMGVRLLFLLSIILSKDVVNAVVTSRFNVQVGEMMKLEYFRC